MPPFLIAMALSALTGAAVAETGGDGFIGPLPFLGFGGKPKRRRRRTALTAGDMRTALTIASAISKKAAENFVLSRTRAG